jgi:hypothetical protein
MDEPQEGLRVMGSADILPISLKEALGAQHFGSGGETKGVRVVDDRGQRLSADVRDDGTVWVRIEGTGVSGNADEVQPCQILVGQFNQDSREWADAEKWDKKEREEGVDVVAKNLRDGRPLLFQVTRVDRDEKLWTDLSQNGVAEKTYPSVDAVADAVYVAISGKLHKPQEGIILALNGLQLPIGFPSVLASFEKRYGAWLRGLKFDEVWVVEPFYDEPWTCRLFKQGA